MGRVVMGCGWRQDQQCPFRASATSVVARLVHGPAANVIARWPVARPCTEWLAPETLSAQQIVGRGSRRMTGRTRSRTVTEQRGDSDAVAKDGSGGRSGVGRGRHVQRGGEP